MQTALQPYQPRAQLDAHGVRESYLSAVSDAAMYCGPVPSLLCLHSMRNTLVGAFQCELHRASGQYAGPFLSFSLKRRGSTTKLSGPGTA
jgi:hypothetical protein